MHIHQNSKLGLENGNTIEGTRVNLERYGSQVSEILANRDGAWKRSRSITLAGDRNQWFTLHNVASKRYLTATGPRTMQIQGQLYQLVNLVMNSKFSHSFSFLAMVQFAALGGRLALESYLLKRCTSGEL